MPRTHGSRLPRGLQTVPGAPSTAGRFGRMFRKLPAARVKDEQLRALAEGMRQEEGQVEDNPTIPAGYTYFGQFVDHDITFDPASSLQRANDPEALINFRSPRFDLDSLYGSGPGDEPFQYDATSGGHIKLLLGKGRDVTQDPPSPTTEDDLPRNEQGTALIGDPRNDENVIVSALQLAFIKLHNRFVDEVAGEGQRPDPELFDEAQRRTRWHYQWVVVHDFLPRLVGQQLVDELLNGGEIRTPHYRPRENPFMPVEFSVAAYRFGHSQIRPTYTINDRGVPTLPIFSQAEDPKPLEDFRGERFLPKEWTVSWRHFFPIGADAPTQASQLINSKLAAGLFKLPKQEGDMQSLALRNLQRGTALGLPSGRRVAGALRVPMEQRLTEQQLGFSHPAPLWFYVLKEAEVLHSGSQLGPVGGRIVAEVLLGLLRGDPLSYINVEPDWVPSVPDADGDGKVGLPDLLVFADPTQSAPPTPPAGGWQPNLASA